MRNPRRNRRDAIRILACTTVVLAAASVAAAQGSGFYLGLGLPFESLSVTYDKTVDNTDPGTVVPPPRAGQAFQQIDSTRGWQSGTGAVAGYHLPLSDGRLFLRTELDFVRFRGGVGGRLEGVGESAGRNELGEVWPDPWELRRRHAYGLSLRFGGSPGALRELGASLYLLAAVQRVVGDVVVDFTGCLSPTPCGGEGLTSGRDSREVEQIAWGIGAGLETTLVGRLGLAAEVRYTIHAEDSWVADFSEVKVTVPTTIGAEGLALQLRLLIHL